MPHLPRLAVPVCAAGHLQHHVHPCRSVRKWGCRVMRLLAEGGSKRLGEQPAAGCLQLRGRPGFEYRSRHTLAPGALTCNSCRCSRCFGLQRMQPARPLLQSASTAGGRARCVPWKTNLQAGQWAGQRICQRKEERAQQPSPGPAPTPNTKPLPTHAQPTSAPPSLLAVRPCHSQGALAGAVALALKASKQTLITPTPPPNTLIAVGPRHRQRCPRCFGIPSNHCEQIKQVAKHSRLSLGPATARMPLLLQIHPT